MRQALKLHPDSRSAAVTRLEARVVRLSATGLSLRFELTGDVVGLVVPRRQDPERADELWRTTCFEAFLQEAGGDGYCEVNLSPSTRWAAYGFDGYRAGMRTLQLGAPPSIAVDAGPDHLTLSATLDLASLARPCRLGLTAVTEDADGTIAYWSLAHPPGRADFHHPDCLALELAPTEPK